MTKKQFYLLEFIKKYIKATGSAPTYSNMKKGMGVTSNQTVDDLLTGLIKDGYLIKLDGKKAGLSLTGLAEDTMQPRNLIAENQPLKPYTPQMQLNNGMDVLVGLIEPKETMYIGNYKIVMR